MTEMWYNTHIPKQHRPGELGHGFRITESNGVCRSAAATGRRLRHRAAARPRRQSSARKLRDSPPRRIYASMCQKRWAVAASGSWGTPVQLAQGCQATAAPSICTNRCPGPLMEAPGVAIGLGASPIWWSVIKLSSLAISQHGARGVTPETRAKRSPVAAMRSVAKCLPLCYQRQTMWPRFSTPMRRRPQPLASSCSSPRTRLAAVSMPIGIPGYAGHTAVIADDGELPHR